MPKTKILLLPCVVLFALCSCSGEDDEHFPYRMKGLDVWVYDTATDKELYAGFTEASYSDRKRGLDSCAFLASAAASSWHLKDWSYVCCTVTSNSKCETKVR